MKTTEIQLNLLPIPLTERAERFIAAGLERGKTVDWFDFVASDYAVVYTLLSALQRGRFCEWGSGLGVVTGLAEMLGYSATGVEIHEPLVQSSRELLAEFALQSPIECGDYHERADAAELYFTYCWPNRVVRTTERFHDIAPPGSRLLIYYGPADIRWIPQEGERSAERDVDEGLKGPA
jgi:hypothetical protein